MWKWVSERIEFWVEAFSFWWLGIALVWSAFSNAATIRDNFFSPERQEKWRTLRVIPHFPWHIWVIGLLVITLLATMEGAFRAWRDEHTKVLEVESLRPYFTLATPGIKPLPQSPPYRIQITMENIGIHPALDMSGKLLILDQGLQSEPTYVENISIANEIPVKTPTPYYNDSLRLPANVPPQYVVFAIKYADPIAKKSYSQVFFMKWRGVVNGITEPDFVHASTAEKQRLTEHLKVTLADFSGGSQ